MQEKFIDLCVDDNNSAYGNMMPQKQEQMRAHLEKLNFKFNTACFDLPASMAPTEDSLEKETMTALTNADTAMGQDLDELFDLIEGQKKVEIASSEVVIEHKWDDQSKKFLELKH